MPIAAPLVPVTADALRAVFGEPSAPTVGIEEELMLLDGGTLDLAPRAPELLAAAGGDPRFKLELPAAQVEIVTRPCATVADAAAELARGRRDLGAAAAGLGLRLAGAGAHPFADPVGVLNTGGRYDVIRAEHGAVADRQLVFGLHVHVAVRGGDAPLRVHDALRSYLPLLAALAAHAPFHGGRDTALASVRPTISEMLPRQGVPPALGSWDALAGALRRTGDPRRWWWELRLHPLYGTVELRVPDAQATVSDAAAIAAVAHALIVWLADRAGAGDLPGPAPASTIAANRRSAMRRGLAGEMAHLETGRRRPTSELLAELLDELEPVAESLGGAREPVADGLGAAPQPVAEGLGTGALAHARAMLASGGPAARLREVGGEAGLRGAVAWLADRFEQAAVSGPGASG
jgi:carboxylate-amine ligase